MTEKPLSGKIALVTGAGRGAGRAAALALAAGGAVVAANDISPINVELLADEIVAAGGQARAYVHDVAKKVALQSMVNDICDEFGRIDILVHSANVEPLAGLLEFDEWDMHRVFEVNAIGAILTTQVVGRVMSAQGGGAIILTAKQDTGRENPVVEASQAAIAGLAESAAAQLSAKNIQVFGVVMGRGGYNQLNSVIFDLLGGKYPAGSVLKLMERNDANKK